MTDIAQRHRGALDEPERTRDLAHRLLFALEEAELTLRPRLLRAVGVLHRAGERAVGEGEAPLATPTELMRQEAEGIGIALEVDKVLPAPPLGTHLILQPAPSALRKVGADGTLPTMTKGRIAHIVRQGGRADDGA